MALSFEESKKQLAQQAATPMRMAAMPMVASTEDAGVMTLDEGNGLIAAYSVWNRSPK